MSEIKIISEKLGELKIDNISYYGIHDYIINAIEQLQQENEHYKYILTEFEKWLEKLNGNGEVLLPREGLDKLQELKNL